MIGNAGNIQQLRLTDPKIGSPIEAQHIGGTDEVDFDNRFVRGCPSERVALNQQETLAGCVIDRIANLVDLGRSSQLGIGIEEMQIFSFGSTSCGVNGKNTNKLCVLVTSGLERTLHEGIQEAILAVEGHAFKTAVEQAVGIDGWQRREGISRNIATTLRIGHTTKVSAARHITAH